MNSLETLLFPNTIIFADIHFPLFLLFSRVHIIQPVDDDEKKHNQSADTFMDSGFCQALPLHPLQGDRERFLYLINDIKNRKDDYAAQLSNITLASLSEEKVRGDESENRIISSLLGRKTNDSRSAESQKRDMLWQARLILKIAEILDYEEDEVARAFSFLEESETDLYSRLKGLQEEGMASVYDDLKKIQSRLVKPRIEGVRKRQRAWFRFIRGCSLPQCPIWSTTRQESAEILFENHLNIHGHTPPKLVSLSLPAILSGEDSSLGESITAFRDSYGEQIQMFLRKVIDGSPENETVDLKTFPAEWLNILTEKYPETQYGRAKVHFHRFEKPIPCYSGLQTSEKEQGATILAFVEALD